MPSDLVYLSDDSTARATPDALRIMLRQAGFDCVRTAGQGGGDAALALKGNKTVLLLGVESGFVSRVGVRVTFVDEGGNDHTDLVCEFLESIGWLPADG
jgi:hypothetical protein